MEPNLDRDYTCQSEKCNYDPNFVSFIKIQKCVSPYVNIAMFLFRILIAFISGVEEWDKLCRSVNKMLRFINEKLRFINKKFRFINKKLIHF